MKHTLHVALGLGLVCSFNHYAKGQRLPHLPPSNDSAALLAEGGAVASPPALPATRPAEEVAHQKTTSATPHAVVPGKPPDVGPTPLAKQTSSLRQPTANASAKQAALVSATAASESAVPPQTVAPTNESTAPAITCDAVCNGKKHPGYGIVAGVGVYILKPFFEDNPAFLQTSNVNPAAPPTQAVSFDWDYSVSPLVWLGVSSSDGFGLRGRFFQFDQASNQAVTANPGLNSIQKAPGLPDPATQGGGVSLFGSPSLGPGTDILTFQSDLRIQTLDLEVTRWIGANCWTVLLSGGGRYLQASQNYSGFLINTGDLRTETVDFGHNFYGGGPTLGLQGTWRLGNSSLVFYGSARGSLLVGDSTQAFFSSESSTGNSNSFRTTEEDLLPIGELELGLSYGVNAMGTVIYIQAAVVDQTYFGLGSASETESNLSLFGFQCSLGIGY